MLTLSLFRHAKSSWDNPALDDFDRPLSPRGKRAAPKMAAFIAERGLVPDHILCSGARRTRETLALALPFWETSPSIDYADALYLAPVSRLLAITRDAPENKRHIMIVGHNPGLETYALRLISGGDPKLRHALTVKFPTAGLAVMTFGLSRWEEVQAGTGYLSHFVTPKQLS